MYKSLLRKWPLIYKLIKRFSNEFTAEIASFRFWFIYLTVLVAKYAPIYSKTDNKAGYGQIHPSLVSSSLKEYTLFAIVYGYKVLVNKYKLRKHILMTSNFLF